MLRERREARREPREILRLRPAVDGHDDGKRSVAGRLEQKDGDRFAVEALETVQSGLDELVHVDLARARRHTDELVVLDVVDVDVARLDRAREREGEVLTARREDRILDNS